MGVYGQLTDTDKIFELTAQNNNSTGQVLGKETYGYLFEVGKNILPYFRKGKTIEHKKNWFMNREEMKLSLFGRYERLNTHHGLHNSLLTAPRIENDLTILTGGVNFNTRENIVFKTNYRYSITMLEI